MKQKLIFLLAFVLLLSACTKAEESVLEHALQMDDVELAELYQVPLQQDGDVFFLAPEDYTHWSPATDGAETPFDASASVLCSADGEGELEEIAQMLTKRWLHVLMLPSGMQNTTFLITSYRNLQVTVYSEETLPEPYRQGITPREQADAGGVQTATADVWYVVPTLEYRYSGTVNGTALDSDSWTSDLGGPYCLMLRLVHSEQGDLYNLFTAKAD